MSLPSNQYNGIRSNESNHASDCNLAVLGIPVGTMYSNELL